MTMAWHASRDAVPEGHVQVTVYDEATGNRMATVFDAQAVPVVTAAPNMLQALRKVCDATTVGDAADAIAEARQVIYEIEDASEVPA